MQSADHLKWNDELSEMQQILFCDTECFIQKGADHFE